MARQVAPFAYPEAALHTMRVGSAIDEDMFGVPAPARDFADVRVIEVASGRIETRAGVARVPVRSGLALSDPERDVLKLAVFERHRATGRRAVAFVRGFGLARGAMASTVAHDAHNLMVLGADEGDMALCANALTACGGGMAVALHGRVLALVPLPIAGLLSAKSAAETAELVERLSSAWRDLGCYMVSPFMTMSMLALPCIPALRLSDRGLIDTERFPLFLH